MHVHKRVQKFLGRLEHRHWDGGTTDPLGICHSPMCYLAKCGHSRSNGRSVITEICQNLTLMSRLSGPLKVTGTDMD